MLARIRKAMEEKEEGFTLIELLVVIIIIGILAAIAIPVFLNQRKKGYDAQTKSDVKNLVTSLETYATDYNGAYPASAASNTAIKAVLPDWSKSVNDTDVAYTLTAGSGGNTSTTATYQIAALSDSGNVFCYQSASSGKGVYKGTGSTVARPGC
jgi:type IV pilus assembly protein PilA